MDDLVERLTKGKHPVTLPRYEDVAAIKRAIEQAYVLLKFTTTRGGTEIGIKLDETMTTTSEANFAQATGQLHLVGELTLNYTKVRVIANIDLATQAGDGYLVLI